MAGSGKKGNAKRGKTADFAKPGVLKSGGKDSELQPPRLIYAQASPHSVGGVSMFDAGFGITAETAPDYTSEAHLVQAAAARLREAGFEILQASESTINIAGAPKTYERAFGTAISVRQETVIKEFGVEDEAEFLDCSNSDLPGLISMRGTEFEGLLEGVALEEPRYYMAANPFPPRRSYWHMNVPEGISLGCNADRAHRAGITGRGVTVAMVDSGWYRHPFFTARGYRSKTAILAPGASNPLADESGHGTGESANVFAVAPDAQLAPVKMSFVNTIAAFNAAVGLNPDIITCSWGSSIRQGPLSAANIVLADAIAAAVAAGITVVFSAGNGHWGFPGQHPDVISAGGVYLDENNTLRASDYASGFASEIYRGRNVPDLSGIVGMRPKAINIMLPLEPGCSIDAGNAGGSHPNGDETAADDGWAGFSGTSAAAPQLAGAAALLKQACGRLTPAEIRGILMATARDVTTGTCHPNQNNPATVGPDLATGHGLVDAHRATVLARLRCRRPPVLQPLPQLPVLAPRQATRAARALHVVPEVRAARSIRPAAAPAWPAPSAPAVEPPPVEAALPDLGEEEVDIVTEMLDQGQIDPEEI